MQRPIGRNALKIPAGGENGMIVIGMALVNSVGNRAPPGVKLHALANAARFVMVVKGDKVRFNELEG